MGNIKQFYLLSEEALAVIEENIKVLLERSGSRCCIVIDRSGYLVHKEGNLMAVHPEEMAAMGAATFSALQSFINMSPSPELTVNFHTKDLDNIHFLRINKQLILMVIYRFYEVAEETIRRECVEFIDKVSPIVSREDTEAVELSSVKFIHNKLEDLFKD